MAIQHGTLSMTVQDIDGNEKSFVDYFKFDDATATLTTLFSAIGVEIGNFDGVTDGKVVNAAMTIDVTLPGGLKADPETGSNVQEAANLTFNTPAPGGLTYTQTIPAFIQAGFTGGVVNELWPAVDAWLTQVTVAGTITSEDDRRAYVLTDFKRGKKTFRK